MAVRARYTSRVASDGHHSSRTPCVTRTANGGPGARVPMVDVFSFATRGGATGSPTLKSLIQVLDICF